MQKREGKDIRHVIEEEVGRSRCSEKKGGCSEYRGRSGGRLPRKRSLCDTRQAHVRREEKRMKGEKGRGFPQHGRRPAVSKVEGKQPSMRRKGS